MTQLQRSAYIGGLLFLSLGGVYVARPFLVPLVIGCVLALLFVRFSTVLEQRGLSRALSSFVCVFTFIIAVGLVSGLLFWQFTTLSGDVDEIRSRIGSMLDGIQQWINQTLGLSNSEQKELLKGEAQNQGSAAVDLTSRFFSVLVNSILVLVYFYLALYQRARIRVFIRSQVSPDHIGRVDTILKSGPAVIQRYLFGLGKMIVLLWILYGIGFSIIGVEGALFFAVLCGTLEIVPFVGNITGTTITVVAVLAQGGDGIMVVSVIATYLLIQFVQTYFLEPLVVGEEVNINPLFTILTIVLGELLWGVAGMFLAIPLLGLLKVICDNIPSLQPYGYLIGTDRRKRGKRARHS